MLRDFFQDAFEVSSHTLVAKAQDRQLTCFDLLLSYLIILALIMLIVDSTIPFDDEMCRVAIKVCNIPPNGMLPPKLGSI